MNSERNVLKLINDISNLTLFVVDQSTLQILYCNQTAAKAGFRRGVFYHPDTLSFDAVNFHQGDYQYFAEKSILGSNVDVRVKRTLWDDEGRQIPALAISVTPHIFAGEVKIRHDHSKDLLQGIDVLFDEYVVIDLVDDRYISPKLGPCASAFPHAGDFTQANDLYGKMLIHPEDRQKFWELTSTKSLRQNMPQENMHIVGELRRLVAPDSFEWIETHLVSTIDAQTGHLKVLWCYRNIEKQKQFELSQREQTAWIAQLSEEYYAVYLVNLSNNTLRGLRVPEQFKKIVHMEECYDKQFSMYVNEFVDPKWQQTLLKITNSTYIIDQFANDNNRIEHIFKNKQGFWLSVKIIPAPGYSDAYPYAVLAFEDLTQKVEHSLSEKTAKMAVAHMYALAISVDMEIRVITVSIIRKRYSRCKNVAVTLISMPNSTNSCWTVIKRFCQASLMPNFTADKPMPKVRCVFGIKTKNCTIIPITVPGYLQSKAKKSCCCCVTSTIKNSRNMNLHYSAPTECAIIISPMRWLKCTMQSIMSTCRNIDFIFCGLPKSSLPIC